MSVKEHVKESSQTTEEVVESCRLVLFDDDVNTFSYVIETLMTVCKHSNSQAEQCVWITHYKGKCVIKKGSYDDLSSMHSLLLDAGLTTEIQ